MQQVIELELWTVPGATPLPLDGKCVAARCRADTKLPEHVVLGLDFVPDRTDVHNLRASLGRQEFSMKDFENFCLAHQLASSSTDAMSASRFLAFVRGQPLAWLHVPAGAEGFKIARQLLRWAESEAYVLKEGHFGDVLVDERSCLPLVANA